MCDNSDTDSGETADDLEDLLDVDDDDFVELE